MARDDPNYTIPEDIRRSALIELAELGDCLFENAAWLSRQGFTRHDVVWNFDAEVLSDQLEVYRMYLIEAAKETIGTEQFSGVVLYGNGSGYKSAMLDQKRAERDREIGERLTPELYSKSRQPWLLELNPLQANIDYRKLQAGGSHWWQDFIGRRSYALDRVRAAEAYNLRAADSGVSRRAVVLEEMLDILGGRLNFGLDGKSTRRFPLLSTPITGPWQLCIGIDAHPTLLGRGTAGRLSTSAHVRHVENAMLPGDSWWAGPHPVNAIIPVNYEHTSLHFSWYRNFDDDRQLRAVCRAHALLLSHQMDRIIGHLSAVLSRMPPTN